MPCRYAVPSSPATSRGLRPDVCGPGSVFSLGDFLEVVDGDAIDTGQVDGDHVHGDPADETGSSAVRKFRDD